MVMMMTVMVFRVPAGIWVTPRATSQFTRGSEKLSAAKAEDRKPARVMAI